MKIIDIIFISAIGTGFIWSLFARSPSTYRTSRNSIEHARRGGNCGVFRCGCYGKVLGGGGGGRYGQRGRRR